MNGIRMQRRTLRRSRLMAVNDAAILLRILIYDNISIQN
jgi:hypothetical protein